MKFNLFWIQDKKPPYEKIDVRMKTMLGKKKDEKGEFKKGMKLEFFDPLDQKMKYLHVATITKILKVFLHLKVTFWQYVYLEVFYSLFLTDILFQNRN